VIELKQGADGVVLPVRVQPRASRNAICGEHNGAVKISLTTPPVEGKANAACIAFLAEKLDLSRSAIELVTGETGRNKLVRVRGLAPEELLRRLGLA